jgi:predicted RNA binding protein YcfA (HicA-like mRNA interferase family)
MSKVPSLSYTQIIAALKRDGWIVVRQRGSHIRLEKQLPDETVKNPQVDSSSSSTRQKIYPSSYFKTSSDRNRSFS